MSLEEVDLPPPPSVRRKILGGGAWGVGGQTTALLLGLASNAIITRVLDPKDAGTYFLVMSLTGAGVLIAVAGLPATIMRLIAESMAVGAYGRARDVLRSGLRMGLISVAAWCAIFFVPFTGQALASIFPVTRIGTVTVFIGLLLAGRALTMQRAQAFRGFQQYGRATIFGLVQGQAFTVAFLALLWASGRHVTLRLAIGAASAALAPGLLASIALLRRKQVSLIGPGSASSKEIRRVAWPLFISGLAQTLLYQSHFWIVSSRLETADVAHYGASTRLANLLTLSLQVAGAVVAPMTAELHALGRRSQLERVVRGTATVALFPTLTAAIAVFLLAPRVLSIVFGAFYADAAPILRMLLVASAVAVWTGHSDLTLGMTGHERWSMTGVLSGLVAGLIVTFATVGTFGPVGAAAGATTGIVVKNLFSWIAAKRLLGISTHAGIAPVIWELRRLEELFRERRR